MLRGAVALSFFGSVRVQTTHATLARYRQAYVNRGWAGADFDAAVAGWRSTDYATDCQGLLDSYLTYVCNDKTDINADMNYRLWCNAKGPIDDITRDYVIGEAVFVSNKNGRMTHVGWICGFDSDGTPLVVEARGLRHGGGAPPGGHPPADPPRILTKNSNIRRKSKWKKIKFEVRSPMLTGDAVQAMQAALSAAGYTDADGKAIAADGKWGRKSQAAFDAMIAATVPMHGRDFPGVPGCTLVFLYRQIPYKTDAKLKKLTAALTERAQVIEFAQQGQQKLQKWVRRRFAAAGKEIDAVTVDHLLFTCGSLMTGLVPEIAKIAAYARGPKITAADIDAVADPVLDARVFDMTDAVAARDYDKAAECLAELLRMQEEPIRILAALGKTL